MIGSTTYTDDVLVVHRSSLARMQHLAGELECQLTWCIHIPTSNDAPTYQIGVQNAAHKHIVSDALPPDRLQEEATAITSTVRKHQGLDTIRHLVFLFTADVTQCFSFDPTQVPDFAFHKDKAEILKEVPELQNWAYAVAATYSISTIGLQVTKQGDAFAVEIILSKDNQHLAEQIRQATIDDVAVICRKIFTLARTTARLLFLDGFMCMLIGDYFAIDLF